MLEEPLSCIGDMPVCFVDPEAAAVLLPIALQRQNVTQPCKPIGFRLDAPVAVATTLRFAFTAQPETGLLISARTTRTLCPDDRDFELEMVGEGILPKGPPNFDVNPREGIRYPTPVMLTMIIGGWLAPGP